MGIIVSFFQGRADGQNPRWLWLRKIASQDARDAKRYLDTTSIPPAKEEVKIKKIGSEHSRPLLRTSFAHVHCQPRAAAGSPLTRAPTARLRFHCTSSTRIDLERPPHNLKRGRTEKAWRTRRERKSNAVGGHRPLCCGVEKCCSRHQGPGVQDNQEQRSRRPQMQRHYRPTFGRLCQGPGARCRTANLQQLLLSPLNPESAQPPVNLPWTETVQLPTAYTRSDEIDPNC